MKALTVLLFTALAALFGACTIAMADAGHTAPFMLGLVFTVACALGAAVVATTPSRRHRRR